MRILRPLLACLPALLLALPAAAADLLAHRALYRLELASARGDITAAGGNMAYEMVDACDAWAVRQRLRIELSNRDGQNIELASDYATLEAKDGTSLRFTMRQTTEQAVTSETEGTATLPAPGAEGTARFSVPKETAMPLPAGTLFPTPHTEAIIAAARAGKKFLSLPLFDGTTAQGPQDTSVAIFSWDPPRETRFDPLRNLHSTRVRIAFFDRTGGNATPDYELSLRFWENGVSDEMSMDFGDFVMRATLVELQALPKGC
jgi:hypothetical protein